MVVESLERRAMLAIDVTFTPLTGVLELDYNQPDPMGLITTSNQNAVIEIDEIGGDPQLVRVNVFRSSNPNADVFLGVTKIIVTVPNFDVLGVNNNSLAIKGLESAQDRIVMAGSGRTAAGRWFDQLPTPDQNQILFEITGIDNLTLTAGGTINVSGSFTNDTNDASITAIGTSLEADSDRTPFPNQHTGTVVLGEHTPEQSPDFPAARLFSNYIHVIGGSIEINSDIEAAGEVSLKVSDLSPVATNLVLPYDITVTSSPRTGNPGRLDLISPRNVVQQATSTITASVVNVVADDTFGASAVSLVDLASPLNDFDVISVQTGSGLAVSAGSVAIRDVDDLVIGSNGLLSTTGLMTVHTAGLLTFDTPIFAGGFKAYSGFGILSTERGTLTIGNGGIDLAARTVAANATGDITLNGRVQIGALSLPPVIINNAIRADGLITIAGGFFSPQAGVTMMEGIQGIIVASPIQVGNTFVNETSTQYVVTDADLTLVASNGFIDILDFSGNSAIPQAVQVTNMLSLDAFGDIFIDGLVFVGTRYGDVLNLTETVALPNIAIRGQADITIGNTGQLETSSYETNADTRVNPLIGAITITDATQLNNFGRIKADGAIEVSIEGDVYLTGSVTARESISMETELGIIDVQGAITTTGYRYQTNPPAPLQERRLPNITLSAPSGSIVTGGRGTLHTGSLEAGATVFGEVRLDAQQDIIIGANILSDGAVLIDSLFGAFELDALLRVANQQRLEILAAAGITQSEFGRIEAALVDASIREAGVPAGIELNALANQVGGLRVRNLSQGGAVSIFTGTGLDISSITSRGQTEITATDTISLSGLMEVGAGNVNLTSTSGNIDLSNASSLIHAIAGAITLNADCGEILVYRLCALEDITLFAPQGVVVFNELRSETGGVTITADAGPMRIRDVFTERNIQMSAAETITLFGLLETTAGEIVVSTTSGAILLEGAQLHALDNRIKLEAHSRIIQDAPGGLIRVDVISSGRLAGDAGDSAPNVMVEIAPPVGGGETATAEAVILRSPALTEDDPDAVDFSILQIVLTNRGSGYAINESPVVTINGMPGAVCVAVGPRWTEHIVAESDVTLAAGENVVLTTIVRSNEGDVRISSIDGNVDLSADEHLVHAVAGSVRLLSQAGGITVQQVTAGSAIDARALEVISLLDRQTAATGDISVESLHGEINIRASLAALQGKLSLVAFDSVNQSSSGGIAGITLLAGGNGYTSGASVSIAPPAAGGAAASAVAVIEDGVVVGITLTSPGSGYALGESPAVTITGATTPGGAPNVPPTVVGGGAAAVAEGPAGLLSIFARDDLSISAGTVVTLGSTVRSAEGDVHITSTNADLALGAGSLWLQADAGSTVLAAPVGFATVNRVTVAGDASLTAAIDTTVVSSLTVGGNATVVSTNGQANVQDASVGGNLVIRSEKGGILNGEFIVETGDMQVTSGVGSIQINAGLTVKAGSLDMVAGSAITQSSNSGISELQLLAGGSGYSNGASVQIANPAAGGTTATAVAVVSQEGNVIGLTITNAGSGYAVGETPRVTIVGGDDQLGEPVGGGAAAAAVGPTGLQNITVEDDIRIATGQGATLTSTIRSNEGNILVTAANGNLGLEAGSLFLNSVAGDVTVIAQAGRVEVQTVVAGGQVTLNGSEDIRSAGLIAASSEGVLLESSRGSVETNGLVAQSGVQVKSFENIKFTGLVHSAEGDILANSQTGVMSLAANIIAEAGQVSLSAFQSILQSSDSGVTRIELTSGGRGYGQGATVTVAPPAGGGRRATAIANLQTVFNDRGDPVDAFISAITILNPGSGYAPGENPIIQISGVGDSGGEGASALGFGPDRSLSIFGLGDISVSAGESVLLSNKIESAQGGIKVTAHRGDVTTEALLLAENEDVVVISDAGGVQVSRLVAGQDIRVEGFKVSTVTDGLVALRDVVVASVSGGVRVNGILAGNDIKVEGLSDVLIEGEVQADQGAIAFESFLGSVSLAMNAKAVLGDVRIRAHSLVTQEGPGVTSARVTAEGSGYTFANVEFAPPASGGGTAATGRVIVTPRQIPGQGTTGVVTDIEVLFAGSGYEPGEIVGVTITGDGTGAAAVATAGATLRQIVAEGDVAIDAGSDVSLTSVVRANSGDIEISSIDGNLDLSSTSQLLHAIVGNVALTALAGGIQYDEIVAGGDLSLKSFKALAINRPLVLNGGGVTLASAGGDIDLLADVLAVDKLSLSAKTGIAQTAGSIKATDLYAENLTPTAITLTAAGNDVERFAAKNVGDVFFSDADSFRVGLQTTGPMGVEVTGANVNLTATDTIRVVAGINAVGLSLDADTVEFVTTAATDNYTTSAAFGGTFRDMIAVSNANTDLESEHEFVFDEPGYPISEINVGGALPAFTRRAKVDGATAAGGRLGVLGSAGVASGVRFGEGSSGGEFTGAAFYGFSSGSAFVINSSDNTVNDLWFGLRANGSAAPANRVGVNVSGARAFNNRIGSGLEFDPATANRFAGHTDAAIVLQRGASNNLVAGNLVGGDGLTANRTGVRIDGGSGNRIGTPDQVTTDLTPTPSNRVVGNTHYGIEIRNVRGSTTLVENNVVAGNATKVGSGTHGIGVLNSAFVQIGGVSELSRNQVFGSLGGSGIHLSGSNNVRILGNVIGSDGYHLSANGHTNDYDANRPDLGNHMHGIHVFGRSRDVLIDSNRIVDNERSGVAIASGSAGVLLTNNEIGVWVHPVTGNVHAAGNDADGVTITAANGNTIGRGNLIGYNGGSGIMVENSVAAGLATGNRLAGAELFGNLGHGIHVSGSSRQTVGGYSGEGNIVKENGLDGIRLENDPRIRASAAPHGNVVAGNFIGTNDNQEIDRNWGNRNGIAVMNGVGNVLAGNVVMNNRAAGVEIGGGTGNTLGGQVESAGNFVGYNFGDGIFIHDQASTQLQVGVVATAITNQGAGYAASRTSVIFTAPAASGGVPARGVAIISASGRVTGIQLTSSGSGYAAGESVSVTIFDPQATTTATATVTLGQAATAPGGGVAVSPISRGHVVSGNEIEANNGVGIYVKGSRTTEIQVGQDFDSRTGSGLGNRISFQGVGVLVEAARRVSVQGNAYGDNGIPLMMMNGANAIPGAELVNIPDLRSTAWGRGQTRVTGTVVNGGPRQEYWVDVYATPYHDMSYDASGNGGGHQMRTFLGRTLITTDASGRAAISLTVSESMGLGDHLSVTLTSNRSEDGATVGVWHALRPHDVDVTASPATGSPTVTPVSSSSGSSTTGRAPVPPRG